MCEDPHKRVLTGDGWRTTWATMVADGCCALDASCRRGVTCEWRTRAEPAQTMNSPQVAVWLADPTGKVLAATTACGTRCGRQASTLVTGVRYLLAQDGLRSRKRMATGNTQ